MKGEAKRREVIQKASQLCRYVRHLETDEAFYIPRLEKKNLPLKVPLPKMSEKLNKLSELDHCELVADDGKTFIACKARLMACSEFFKAMFNSSMMESNSKEIKIREISSQNLGNIVSACNSAEITLVNYDQILELLQITEQYQMPEFKLDLLSFLGTVPMGAFPAAGLWGCETIIQKVLETVSINSDEEKREIATWMVNNWERFENWKGEGLSVVSPILDFFEHYLDVTKINFSQQ